MEFKLTDEKRYFKKGDKVRCTSSPFPNLTKGKIYETVNDEDIQEGYIQVITDDYKIGEFWASRFELVKVYTLEDIKEGMVLRCTDNRGYDLWTIGNEYIVKRDGDGLYIKNNIGDRSYDNQIVVRLNNKGSNAMMEIVSTPEKVIREATKKVYTKEDIKVGMKLRCTHNAGFDFWTVDKIYEVVADDMNRPCIYSDSKPYSGSYRDTEEIALYLNCNSKDSEDNVAMEIVDMPEVSETFDEDVKANEEIVLVIKGKNYYELRDEAIAIQRLLNSIIEDSESLNESLTNLSTFYGSEK